jgi:hypothetical protein
MESSPLDQLIRATAPATLYVCGGADNELEMADRFTQVFLLEIDEPTCLPSEQSRLLLKTPATGPAHLLQFRSTWLYLDGVTGSLKFQTVARTCGSREPEVGVESHR